MVNYISDFGIKNFKSIKKVEFNNCSRINVFVGKPNVGKSNLLESLGLFGLPFYKKNMNHNLQNFIRLESIAELFYDGEIDNSIEINTNLGNCHVNYGYLNEEKWSGRTQNISTQDKYLTIEINTNDSIEKQILWIDDKLKINSDSKNFSSFIRKYSFSPNIKFKDTHSSFLIPPFGNNLLNIIESNIRLKDEFTEIFLEYGLKLVFDKASRNLKIMKYNQKKDVFILPFNSIADTLQRIIFFKTAISSNENAVLLFEEPEAHSFPPYIAHITQEIIHSNKNQFFISTHSPFVINDFLENCPNELSIFLIGYQNGETIIRKLTAEEQIEMYQYGVDIFTNIESYLIMELSFLPECYIDTNLLETISPPKQRYNHQKGCGTIARKMQKELSDKFAVGIIDKDKFEIKYVREFDLVSDCIELQLYRHKDSNKHHYIIFLVPAIEKWILDCAKSVEISLESYSLPNELIQLTNITKKETSQRNPLFKSLFQDLKNIKAKNIQILSFWIEYLNANNYNSDLNELKVLTKSIANS